MDGIALDKNFFNEVISESYYSIFYSAKAYLLFNSIKTYPPEEQDKIIFEIESSLKCIEPLEEDITQKLSAISLIPSSLLN